MFLNITSHHAWKLSFNDTTLEICNNGNIIINGSVKDAAKALFLDVIKKQDEDLSRYGYTIYGFERNNIRIYYDKDIILHYEPYIGIPVPEIFHELKEEFDKLTKLQVFL